MHNNQYNWSDKTMTKINEVPFLIIGGGIGGLATALSVAKEGQSVYVLEQAPEFGEIGAGLQLGPNALAALDKLGVLEKINEFAVFPQRLVLMDALTGNELTALDLGNTFRERYGYPYCVMHRSDLHKVLLNACQDNNQITLLNNKTVVSVENLENSVIIKCDDNSTYVADAVVGADGLWSIARKLIVEDEPVCSEYVAYRGTLPISEITSHARLDDVICWIAPEMHVVQYPVRRKELYNQVVVFKSNQYRKEIEKTDQWGTTKEMDERFKNCCESVKIALDFIQRQRRWPLFDRNPIENWTEGRVTLMGDSAHPMLQYLAQGACQALEDAVTLGEKFIQNRDDILAAFTSYQQERIPRTGRVQRTARTFGNILHTTDEVAILLRNTIFSQCEPDDYSNTDWIYGHYAVALYN